MPLERAGSHTAADAAGSPGEAALQAHTHPAADSPAEAGMAQGTQPRAAASQERVLPYGSAGLRLAVVRIPPEAAAGRTAVPGHCLEEHRNLERLVRS